MGESKRKSAARAAWEAARARGESVGDGPIQEEYFGMMRDIAEALDRSFNGDARGDARQTGFVLMVFPYGAVDGRCNYISNGAAREDIVVLMKEMIARFEGQPEAKGRA